MTQISNEAVERAADALNEQWPHMLCDGVQNHVASASLEAAGSLLVAGELDAIASNYPADLFPADSTTQDGIAGTAIREVLTRQAAALRVGAGDE